MAIKPCNLVLKNMNERGSSDSSEASTPEEYLTPSGESILLSDNSAFSFPDLSRESQSIGEKSLDNGNLADEQSVKRLATFDINLNHSEKKCISATKNMAHDNIGSSNIGSSNMNNNLNKHSETVEKDIETKPIKLKPEKQNQPFARSSDIASVDGDLTSVRKKLEERRRKMELEKKRQEQQWCRQRQAISKEAYSTLFGREVENAGEFHLSSGDRARAKWNLGDNKAQSSGYYRHDSAVAMERLFANEESTDGQLIGGTLDRNFLKKQKATSETINIQQGKPTLDRKKTSSFRESSTSKNKISEQRNSVDQNYGLSLDRLNSSLSELQGEIMRLSLQQDHIKNLVSLGDSPNHSVPVQRATSHSLNSANKGSASRVSAPEEASKGRADSRQGGGGDLNTSKVQPPLRNSAFQRYTEGRDFQNHAGRRDSHKDFDGEYVADHSYQDGLEEELLNHQGNIPYPHPAVIPALSPYPFLHPFHPPPFYSYGINPYYHSYAAHPHYSLRSRPVVRDVEYRSREGQLKRDLSLGGIPDLRSVSRRHEQPRRDSLSASRSSFINARSDHRLPRPSSVVSDYFPTSRISSFDRSSLDYDAVYFKPHVARNPSFSGATEDVQSRRMSQGISVPEAGDDLSLSPSAFACDGNQDVDDDGLSQSESFVEEETLKSIQQPEFFIVNLEEAKRPRPEIGIQRKSKVVKESFQTPPLQPSEMLTVTDKMQEDSNGSENMENVDILSKSEDEKIETGSIGFIIEDANVDPSISLEVEKRRLKLAELHQRRKDELEAKLNIINKDQQTKKELLRLKEEKALKKKSEDKQRRDLIFQKYLMRKSERSETNSDDDSVKQFSSSSTPPKSAASKLRTPSQGSKRPRPHSQLVVSCAGKEASSTFPDDCSIIITAVKQPLTAEPKIPIISDVGGNSDEKKSAQERFSRFLSCGSEGDKAEDTSGLKLFVKPNQKSNRNIIINAIKDCCLAGVVNQDLKNKVLEEINRNESKHFVVLFRDAGLQYRGLYSYNPEKQEVSKIHGVGPKQLSDKSMEKFYKYNSGSKNFSEVTSTKHLSSTIDGVTILSCLWNRKQPACTTPRKATT